MIFVPGNSVTSIRLLFWKNKLQTVKTASATAKNPVSIFEIFKMTHLSKSIFPLWQRSLTLKSIASTTKVRNISVNFNFLQKNNYQPLIRSVYLSIFSPFQPWISQHHLNFMHQNFVLHHWKLLKMYLMDQNS